MGEQPPDGFDEWVDWLIDLIERYPPKFARADAVFYDQMIGHIREARAHVPKSTAHWETAVFFGWAVAATVAMLGHGRVENYGQFRQLASAVFGWEVRPFIPALFAAGTMHPALQREWAERLASTMTLHDLRIMET